MGNAHIFRKLAAAEAVLLRHTMPRTSAADAEAAPETARRVVITVRNTGTTRLVRLAPVLAAALKGEVAE